MPKSLSIFGVTGSIGRSAVDVVLQNPHHFSVDTVTAHKNVDELIYSAKSLKARRAIIADEKLYSSLKEGLQNTSIMAEAGGNALREAAQTPVECLLNAIVGAAGLAITYAVVDRGGVLALANKESLVVGGELVMKRAQETGAIILPVDSEHNALFQLMQGQPDRETIARYTLTASGGPFRTLTMEQLKAVTTSDALKHPTWSMGTKITIDSATLMNKGLELIEAHHLFNIKPNQMDVLVHPQSLVHALITFCDGSMHASLAAPDMRLPIAYCLHWPQRLSIKTAQMNWSELTTMTFEQPDRVRFPCLRLAEEVMFKGASYPLILNAANEIAVAAFLKEELSFMKIPNIIESCLEKAEKQGLAQTQARTVEEVSRIDELARLITVKHLQDAYKHVTDEAS
jgi:1-deoxy-D-xylulose-5-phosphate reductoisomerase